MSNYALKTPLVLFVGIRGGTAGKVNRELYDEGRKGGVFSDPASMSKWDS